MPDQNQQSTTLSPELRELTFEQMNTILGFRKVWTDLAYWMRTFFFSLLEDQPNIYAVTNRLYRQVPLEFYQILSTFYGADLAERFLGLLSRHILLFWQLAEAMKNKDTATSDAVTQQIYSNSEDMASFLADINPYWDKTLWTNLLTQYSTMKIQHILTILQGNWDQEIQIFDRVLDLARTIGTYMARGVILRSQTPAQTQPPTQP